MVVTLAPIVDIKRARLVGACDQKGSGDEHFYKEA
jgi:hypothetical protein